MSRYTSLFRLPGSLYTSGSPLIISAGALLRDDQIGRVLAQIKFKSLSSQRIVAVKVALRAFDISGEELEGVGEYQYLDLSAGRGDDFGDRRAVPLPNPVTRSFSVSVSSVLFEDGSGWQGDENCVWEPLERPEELKVALGSEELAEQYVRDTSRNSRYVPTVAGDLWFCSCGAVNTAEETSCTVCGAERDALFEAFDRQRLEENRIAWVKAQSAANDERRQSSEKHSKLAKVLLTLIPLLLLAGAVFFAATRYFLPAVSYNRAQEMLSLQDFDGAAELFASLGEYKDAPDRVLTARYGAATALMNSGRLEEAKAAFSALGDYSDSSNMITRCDYIAAEKLLEAKDYEAARAAFLSLGEYTDAAERANEALYAQAQALLKDGKSDEAVVLFDSLGDYSDAAEQAASIREASVEQVLRYVRQNRFDEAWSAYEALDNYSPEPLTAEDFIVPDGDMREYLDDNTTEDMFFGSYHYTGNGYDGRKDVTVTARDIRLGDSRLEVLMAYGEGDESGEFSTERGFYLYLPEASQAIMREECVRYVRYSLDNYKMYFYFDADDELSWLIFANGDYGCAPAAEPAEPAEAADAPADEPAEPTETDEPAAQ